MDTFVTLLLLMIGGVFLLLIFGLILIGKGIQFTLTATNLYKKMITRQDLIIKTLLDIRDNTKYLERRELMNYESEILTDAASAKHLSPSDTKNEADDLFKEGIALIKKFQNDAGKEKLKMAAKLGNLEAKKYLETQVSHI